MHFIIDDASDSDSSTDYENAQSPTTTRRIPVRATIQPSIVDLTEAGPSSRADLRPATPVRAPKAYTLVKPYNYHCECSESTHKCTKGVRHERKKSEPEKVNEIERLKRRLVALEARLARERR